MFLLPFSVNIIINKLKLLCFITHVIKWASFPPKCLQCMTDRLWVGTKLAAEKLLKFHNASASCAKIPISRRFFSEVSQVLPQSYKIRLRDVCSDYKFQIAHITTILRLEQCQLWGKHFPWKARYCPEKSWLTLVHSCISLSLGWSIQISKYE